MEFIKKAGWKEWDYNGALKKGNVSRVGKFVNAEGMNLAFYSWEVPNPKGVVIFSHGHGVHATFELLNSVKAPGIRTQYKGTWVEAFNKAGTACSRWTIKDTAGQTSREASSATSSGSTTWCRTTRSS